MLDQDAPGEQLKHFVESVPCLVELTDELLDRYGADGGAPTMPHDERRFPRARLKLPKARAVISVRSTYPSLNRNGQWRGTYVTNVSRGGFQLLYDQEVYPGERMRVLAANGKATEVTLVHCRRVADGCFELGVQFVARANSQGLSPTE